MRFSPWLWAVACHLLLATPAALAHAGDEDELALVYGDKAGISIVTGQRQLLRRAPAVATVITAEDIAAMGATDLDEVLATVPGLHVSRNNQGYNPLYVIRGISSEFNPQTLVLLDGVPMTWLFVGNRGNGWGGFPLEHVARIEVIRGPGSALYGADAFSGVVNIITKTAADIVGTEVGLRGGSFQTSDGWVQHGGQLGGLDVAAYLRAGHSDGFRRIIDADAQTFLDQIFGTHASLAPGPVNTRYEAFDLGFSASQGPFRFRLAYKFRQLGTGAGVAGALDPVSEVQTHHTIADLSWGEIELAPALKLGAAASFAQYIQDFTTPLQLFPPGAFGGAFPQGMFGAPHTWERQLRLSAVTTYSGLEHQSLRLGIGHDDLDLYKTQEFKNFTFITSGQGIGLPVPTPGAEVIEFPVEESFLTPHRRRVDYAYIQDEWNFAQDWALTAGVRHDSFSDSGGTTNPRLALVWDASLDLTAKLLYGRAFRAPAFTEQYSINNPVYRGNPNLRPETIRTLEAAFSWQARGDLQLNLSLFRYAMQDIIRTTPAGDGTIIFNNLGSQRGHGFELEASWDPTRLLHLAGYYAYQRSIDEATGQDAGYAPHHQLYARADWSLASGWIASTQAKLVADRHRAPGDARRPIADYTTVDLTVRTRPARKGWEFAASVRNLFDADVREPSLAPGVSLPHDLPMAPRSVYLEASYRL